MMIQRDKNKTFFKLSTLLFSLVIAFTTAECAYRKVLFGESPLFKKIRKAELYSEYDTDEYWKLDHFFDGVFKPPKNPHPLLGWVGQFDSATLRHTDSNRLKDRQPVLMYGDSYASCVTGVDCFQQILNNDPDFSKKHYLLNYGVGGYGVDQISLLLKKTYGMYPNRFVIFSIMCRDLDRSVLTWRTGQKPYYELHENTLVLKGVPIHNDPEAFLEQNPIRIHSYLWRRLLFSPRNPFPLSIKRWLKGDQNNINKKIAINEKILQDTIAELKRAHVKYTFLVFHYLNNKEPEFSVENDDNWRDRFLRQFIEDNRLPYIWTKALVRNDPNYHKGNLVEYIRKEDGHPTTYFNQLVATEIKKTILGQED